MTHPPDHSAKPEKPVLGDAAQAEAIAREARRAAALRANLMRRKGQARKLEEPARQDEAPSGADEPAKAGKSTDI